MIQTSAILYIVDGVQKNFKGELLVEYLRTWPYKQVGPRISLTEPKQARSPSTIYQLNLIDILNTTGKVTRVMILEGGYCHILWYLCNW